MENPSNRHDLTDRQWEPIIQKQLGKWGGSNANDTRTLINGVGWILRTGSLWRDLPNEYGKLSSVHKRFKRWCIISHKRHDT